MKKMMILFCAFVVSASAHAATLSWGCDWVYPTGAYNEGSTSGTFWLVSVASFDDLSGIYVDASGTLHVGSGDSALTSGGIAEGYLFGNNPISGDPTTLNNRNYLGVAWDPTAQKWGYSEATWINDSADLPQPVPGSIMFGDGDFYMELDLDPVPEPTSMALLALGVAAVGLRRRFRK